MSASPVSPSAAQTGLLKFPWLRDSTRANAESCRSTTGYTFIHIDDMVRAIEAAIERPADRRVIFVGHPTPVTTRGLVEQIRAAVGRSAVIVPVPLGITRAAAALCDLTTRVTGRLLPLDKWRYAELAAAGFVCRVDLMRELLNVEPEVDLQEGIASTAAWYREHAWLRGRRPTRDISP